MVILSKAQNELHQAIKSGAKLIQVKNTWINENVFIQLTDGTCKRVNIKVVRKLLEHGLIKTKEQAHDLIQEFELNEQI